VAKGKGSLRLFLEFIPQEKEIRVGELIITTSLGGIFPKGLLVGEIEEVFRSDIEPFQKAKIYPFFDLEKIENLFIITDLRIR